MQISKHPQEKNFFLVMKFLDVFEVVPQDTVLNIDVYLSDQFFVAF